MVLLFHHIWVGLPTFLIKYFDQKYFGEWQWKIVLISGFKFFTLIVSHSNDFIVLPLNIIISALSKGPYKLSHNNGTTLRDLYKLFCLILRSSQRNRYYFYPHWINNTSDGKYKFSKGNTINKCHWRIWTWAVWIQSHTLNH